MPDKTQQDNQKIPSNYRANNTRDIICRLSHIKGRQRIGCQTDKIVYHKPCSDIQTQQRVAYIHRMKSGTPLPCRNHQACVQETQEKTRSMQVEHICYGVIHKSIDNHLMFDGTVIEIIPL